MEELCRERRLNLSELSLAEQDELWEEVKEAMSNEERVNEDRPH
jgi:hypothetical protein